eukprot:gene17537-23857_t
MASMIHKLPVDVMDSIFKVFLANNDSCRTYCKNRLICKGINTLPYQFKLNGSDNVDDFFKYAATRFTINQLADPKGDEEIAFADQCRAVFLSVIEKNKQNEAWNSFYSAKMASMITNIPADVMDIIFKVSSDTCRTYCKNRLICKGINTLPYKFKLDGSAAVDDFFKYASTRFTVSQLANPQGDEEIAFSNQCKEVFSAAIKNNNQEEVWDSLSKLRI